MHASASTSLSLDQQVALNGDDEYEGGRLVFATGAGFVQPSRPCGTATGARPAPPSNTLCRDRAQQRGAHTTV